MRTSTRPWALAMRTNRSPNRAVIADVQLVMFICRIDQVAGGPTDAAHGRSVIEEMLDEKPTKPSTSPRNNDDLARVVGHASAASSSM